MMTKDLLAQAQHLALMEQLTPGDPILEQDFRAFVLTMAAHVTQMTGDDGLLRRLLDTNEELLRTVDWQATIITRQAARIEHLAAALDTLKRRGDGEAPHVL